jgi:peptidyl-tRNA hydrolase
MKNKWNLKKQLENKKMANRKTKKVQRVQLMDNLWMNTSSKPFWTFWSLAKLKANSQLIVADSLAIIWS